MVFVAFPAYPAMMVLVDHEAAEDVSDVMELKVIEDCGGKLDLRDLLVVRDLLV